MSTAFAISQLISIGAGTGMGNNIKPWQKNKINKLNIFINLLMITTASMHTAQCIRKEKQNIENEISTHKTESESEWMRFFFLSRNHLITCNLSIRINTNLFERERERDREIIRWIVISCPFSESYFFPFILWIIFFFGSLVLRFAGIRALHYWNSVNVGSGFFVPLIRRI